MDEAGLICARLLREGTLTRSSVPGIGLPEVRAEVERKLGAVGLMLATSAYSDHIGIRLSPDMTSDPAFDAASNLGLKADECALLVVLWAKLVMQKRTAADSHVVPGQSTLTVAGQTAAANTYTPYVKFETLVQEFGPMLGSRSHIQRLLGRLKGLDFVRTQRGERIVAGPLLELGLDGERMVAFIRKGVLAEMAERPADEEVKPESEGVDEKVIRVLRGKTEGVPLKEISVEIGENVDRIRKILKELEQSGEVRRIGEKRFTRYRLVED